MVNSKKAFLGVAALLYVLNSNMLYPQATSNIDDVYLQVKAEKLVNDFFMIKYDYTTDEAYIGLNSFFYFLELYGMKVDNKNYAVDGIVDGQRLYAKFNKNEAFVDSEGELYVKSSSLIEKLEFEYIRFDMSTLTLDVKTKFLLPYQEKELGRIQRLRLEGRKEADPNSYDLEMKRSLINPGILKLNYIIDNVEEKENDYLSYEYGTQFLYGELYLSGTLEPNGELNTGKLTYSDIVGNSDLTFGDITTVTPNFMNLDSNVLGVSLDSYDTYSLTENGITVIRGEAENVDSIELYRNGILVDYQTNPPRDFQFYIADGATNAQYILKIYYKDGKIEERTVYSLNDMDALKKGTHKPTIQLGKTRDKGKFQATIKDYYGLTDNLTIGGGYLNLIDSEGTNFKILEQSFIYNTRAQYFPTLINFTNYYEVDQAEDGYNLSINQKIYDYDLRATREKYSKYMVGEDGTKEYNSLSLTKSFNYYSLELGVDKRIDLSDNIEEETKNIFGGIYTSYFNPISLSLRVEKTLEGDNDYITYYPSLSYSSGVNVILDGEIQKDENRDRTTEEYSLRISKRRMEILKNRLFADIDLGAEYSSETKDFTYSLGFSIDLEDFVNIGVDHNTDFNESGKRTSTTGLEITKAINLATPLAKVDNDMSVNSYIIQGKVFLDKNGNGLYDIGEPPLKDVGVIIDNREFITDKYGNYLGDGLSTDGIITLDVNRKTMDPMLKHTKGALKIKPHKSASIKVDIPVEVVSMITGNIWNTEDFTEREFIQNISMSTIQLEKDGKLYKEIDPEFDGLFFFEDVPPGKYNMKFIYLGQEDVKFSPESIEVNVKLQNPEEGEYFEGNDTLMKREEDIEQVTE